MHVDVVLELAAELPLRDLDRDLIVHQLRQRGELRSRDLERAHRVHRFEREFARPLPGALAGIHRRDVVQPFLLGNGGEVPQIQFDRSDGGVLRLGGFEIRHAHRAAVDLEPAQHQSRGLAGLLGDQVIEVRKSIGHQPHVDVRVVQPEVAQRDGPAHQARGLKAHEHPIECHERCAIRIAQLEALERERKDQRIEAHAIEPRLALEVLANPADDLLAQDSGHEEEPGKRVSDEHGERYPDALLSQEGCHGNHRAAILAERRLNSTCLPHRKD